MIPQNAALRSLSEGWKNVPPSWNGPDPCGDRWEGIQCVGLRVISITLPSMGLIGQLSGDIQGLSELQTLDLSYNKGLTGSLPSSIGNLKKLSNLYLIGCDFSGPIPDTIGSLEQLTFLSLNSNNFIGEMPSSIGSLSHLYWLDLADNKLSGKIPVSNGSTPGLDMLVNAKHFHLGKNQLSGQIPPTLFSSSMTLIHLLLENNSLSGRIPSTIGLVQTLEVVRLDKNSLSGSVPRNLNNLTKVTDLFLSNNKLSGQFPNLTGMNQLNYVDFSNNSFSPSEFPPWFPMLQSLKTVVIESTLLKGPIPISFFSLSQLQSVILKNNMLNGTLKIGSSYGDQLELIDLQNNFVDSFTESSRNTVEVILVGNPVCDEGVTENYCMLPKPLDLTYSTPPNNCSPPRCSDDQIASPTCQCAYPYTGNLFFRALALSTMADVATFTSLEDSMMQSFMSQQLPVDSVSLGNAREDSDNYIIVQVKIFPSGQDHFNRTGISGIGFVYSNQTFKPPPTFGPYFFVGDSYNYFSDLSTRSHKSSTGIIIGAAVGGSFLLLLSILAGVYAFRQKRRAESAALKSDPFASWNPTKNSGGVPQLNGARCFSFEELKKYTNNFSEINDIGSGGYGKVYRGILPNGQLVAIKRALQGSMQGSLEFKTEIELLSRVHHKNVVALVGFCFDHNEQMLVYEYIHNGTLKDSLSGKSAIRLDWMSRLRVALGAARGLQYLHDLVNPPIIHRDIKSNNILLTERLNAKVADFGLSKPVGDTDRSHVTTQVKGTMGYLDPEYYMTNQLTEKSDVYSFGVVLLELITARRPIEKGKYIVREVRQAMDTSKEMYNLHGMVDPVILSSLPPRSLEKFVDLAMRCIEDAGASRPAMSEVVKEIENIMELVGLNPNGDSGNYEGASKGLDQPYGGEGLFAYTGAYQRPMVEPK